MFACGLDLLYLINSVVIDMLGAVALSCCLGLSD